MKIVTIQRRGSLTEINALQNDLRVIRKGAVAVYESGLQSRPDSDSGRA